MNCPSPITEIRSPDGLRARLLLKEAMNPTVLRGPNGEKMLLARKIRNSKNPRKNTVDYSLLTLYTMEGKRVRSLFTERELEKLRKIRGIVNIEDARAGQPDENKEIEIGVTVVMENKRRELSNEIINGQPVYREVAEHPWYPGRLKGRFNEKGKFVVTSDLEVFTDIKTQEENGEWQTVTAQGKNFTPLGKHPLLGNISLTRVDDAMNRHVLSIVSVEHDPQTKKKVLVKKKKLVIPESVRPHWVSERVGTVGGPLRDHKGSIVYDENDNMTVFIHGQEIIDGKVVYRIGVISVTKDWDLVGVNQTPIIEKSHTPAKELRSAEKVVVYSCDGGILKDGIITIIVAAGDMQSFEVTVPLTTIRKKVIAIADEIKRRNSLLEKTQRETEQHYSIPLSA